jgi:four helix bundle protein
VDSDRRQTMPKSIAYEKAFDFAVQVIYLFKDLSGEKREYVISKQILRSGTSIGANIKEALQGQTKRDFIYKINIALKEASETEYWLELLVASNYIDQKVYKQLLLSCQELIKIMTAIIKTAKQSDYRGER